MTLVDFRKPDPFCQVLAFAQFINFTYLNIKLYFLSKILTNAHLEHTPVTLMLIVPTPKDRSTARVIRDTLEMESRVLVSGDEVL